MYYLIKKKCFQTKYIFITYLITNVFECYLMRKNDKRFVK